MVYLIDLSDSMLDPLSYAELTRARRVPFDGAREFPWAKVKNRFDFAREHLRRSLRALSPDNPVLLTLAKLPINPRAKFHSIIGDQDGYAPYDSAHLDGAESELRLPVGHSIQKDPRAARETRRIILEHIAAYDASLKKR